MPFIIGLYVLLLSDKRKKGKERGRGEGGGENKSEEEVRSSEKESGAPEWCGPFLSQLCSGLRAGLCVLGWIPQGNRQQFLPFSFIKLTVSI